ncbi:MAG: trypsin-like peptidase domain-containing protein, partial [Caldilinea sp.]
MRTRLNLHWKISLTLCIVCIALSLPLTVGAATPPSVEQRATATPTPASGPVDTLEDVQSAVVRIEAVGVFKDPAEGMLMEAGSGTGFIIDPEGYVVTNNHVVTGAAFFRVYVDGRSRPVNARVLGVSECADLAVIDLQGGDYPFLAWYDQPLKVGLDVYAAGFPLGDPEYTLTRGIIAKARADGETDWASVDGVIQHDAVIDHGNSGGPLVTADGLVAGVNYAGDRDANQFYAIGRDNALEIVEQLLEGTDVDSIGVNGRAVVSDDGAFFGIWVSSVATGSPADEAGLEPGDIILSLENLPVAEDGTMSTYCDILRSRSADDVMAVEVLRLDTEEVLKGQINGRPLQQSVSLASAETDAAQTGSQQVEAASLESYDEFVSVADAQGVLTFDAPVVWKDVQDDDWVFSDGIVGIRLDISPDLQNFYDNWSIPGAILRYSESMPDQMAVEDLLDEYTLDSSCTKGERDTITVGDLAGAYQFWDECGGTPTTAAIVALAPSETNAFYVLIELYGAEAPDLNAWDTLLNSLVVTPLAGPEGATPAVTNVAVSSDSALFDLVDTSDLLYSYVAVEDPAISALIPADFGDITSVEWTNSDGEPLGFILTAAPDIAEFNVSWNTPGIIVKSAVGMVEELDVDEMLKDEGLEENCTFDDRYVYTHTAFDRTYNITFDVYEQCGGTDSSYALMFAQSDPIDQVVFVDFVAVSDADVEAYNTFMDSFYLDAELAGGTAAGAGSAPTAVESGPIFVTVSDDTKTISLRVPESWVDQISEDWDLGEGPVGVAFSAAPDVQQFNDTWDTPGIFIGVSDSIAGVLSASEVLDFFDLSDDCVYDDRYEYETSALAGQYDIWNDCGDIQGGTFVVMAATPLDADAPMIVLYTNLPTPEDADLFGGLVNTLAVAGAVQSAQAAQQEDVLSGASAIVIVDRLNVRSGPGTNFNRVGAVASGEALVVIGQTNNCSWLEVVTPGGVEGWVSGSSEYVTLNARCTDIPEASAPAAPATGSQSGSGQTAGGQSSGANAGKGCYLFQNGVGPELTITFTNKNSGRAETFKVPGNGEVERCFEPGRYTYTLDAPPP